MEYSQGYSTRMLFKRQVKSPPNTIFAVSPGQTSTMLKHEEPWEGLCWEFHFDDDSREGRNRGILEEQIAMDKDMLHD